MNVLLQAPTRGGLGQLARRIGTLETRTENERMTEDNEKLVRAFYAATVPGHRQSLSGLQSVHVMCDVPEGCPLEARV